MEHLVIAVVEAKRIPSRMLATLATVEILVRVASEVAESFDFVLHSMRVYDVHDDSDAMLVGFIDELFQFLRCAETAAWCEEVGHMIAEAAIVRMLGNCHDLNAVVAILDDARQNLVLELGVSSHLFCILSHTDVTFIDEQRFSVWLEVLFLPNVRSFGCPHLCGEDFGVLILHHAVNPGRDALPFSTVPLDMQLEQVAMLHGTRTELQFPVA